MSAAQTVERDAHRLVVGIGSYGLEFEFGGEVDATGRSDHEFAVGFVVEVEEDVAFEEAVFHVFHAVHGGFLVGGHEGLEGAVAEGVIFEDGHDGGDGHAVVGTEGGVASTNPVAVDPRFDGIGFEVVGRIGRLLRHHVDVTLERHDLAVFHAGRGRLVHQNVAGIVKTGFEVAFLRPVEEELLDFFEVSGRTGHLREQVEVAPEGFRLKFQNFAHNVAVLDCFLMRSRSAQPHAPVSTTRAV